MNKRGMTKHRILRYIVFLSMASTVSGCFDCMVRGIDARTCGRIKLNTDVIERHQEETVEFNSIIKSGKISNIMSQEEVEDVLGHTCNRFREIPLPANPDTDPDVRLGNYYSNHFCKLYESDTNLFVFKREIKHSETAGTMYFVLTDGEKALQHIRWPITYSNSGYKFGVY